MTEPTLVAQSETFNILQLPQDVQLSILLAFNIRELVICKRMCRSLANLIDDDICIRYKIELARSGRIDGAPSVTVTVADRLTSLREHRARFHAGDHPLKRVREQPFGSLAALSSNGFVTTIAGGSVDLWRPSTTFSGIREQKIGRSMRDLDLEGVNTGSCVADVSQDLLVFSRKDPDAIPLDCFIYSLSKGRPHPSASQCHISSSLGSEDWADSRAQSDSIQVLGDLIAWNVHNLNGRHCEMRVINWKTGITVWEFHNEFWWRCRLVSQSHVVVVTFESLLVYPINLHLKGPSAPSTSDTVLCILQLPAWSSIGFSRSLFVKSYIQFPPPLSPNDRPLYRHDPDLTLLTLYIRYIVDIPDHELRLDQYAMFIPISTINTRVEVSTPSPSPPGGSPHVVQWNDWGPTGTHIARFDLESPCHFSPMGCSCAVAQRRRDPSGNLFLRVLVFDVHPWARPDPQHVKEASGLVHATEPDTLLAGPAFTETIRTTFPFDVTRKDIPLTRDDRYPVVVLTEDGLLLVTSPVDIP